MKLTRQLSIICHLSIIFHTYANESSQATSRIKSEFRNIKSLQSFALEAIPYEQIQEIKSSDNLQLKNGIQSIIEYSFQKYLSELEKITKCKPIFKQKSKHEPWLIYASRNGDISIIKAFVNARKNLNETNLLGYTALIQAAGKYHHPEIVDLLLKAGANPNIQVKWFFNYTALLMAIRYRQKETALELIQAKADSNLSENQYGQSPLLMAINQNLIEVAFALLEAGANPNNCYNKFTRWKPCDSPLIEAVKIGHTPLVRKLIHAGANVSHKNFKNKNALDYARKKNNTDIIQLIENTIQSNQNSFNCVLQ